MLKNFAFVVLAILGARLLIRRSRKLGKLPPGPPKLPIIENLLNMPKDLDPVVFAELAKQYNSDILHFSALGLSVVVLNSYQAAQDLLEQRSGIYSGRPHSVMRNELSDFNTGFAFAPYGDLWRASRKMFTRHFNEFKTTPINRPREIYYTRRFVDQILRNPADFRDRLYSLLGTLTISMTYGIRPQETNDPYIKLAAETAEAVEKSADGTYIVDFLPFLKYLPVWFPGANFQRVAAHARSKLALTREGLFEAGKQAMGTSDFTACFISEALNDLEGKADSDKDEVVVKEAASMVYFAATDTSSATLATFFLAMARYPEVQKKAQQELDRVIKGRLPEHNDLDNLPYMTALILEVLRWSPAVPLGVPHSVLLDDIYNGYHIPKDSVILPNQWAMLQNPEDYPDPSEFKPERFLKDGKLDPSVRSPADIAFGFGRRICPGKHIALSIIKMVVATVLITFDIKKKVGDDGVEIEPKPEFIPGIVVQPTEFPCEIKPRSAQAQERINAWISVEGDNPP